MPSVIVAGGGLAGLAAAAALADAGCRVDVLEARGLLGGRASSFPLEPSRPDSTSIDNCQHILLGCCVNLLDFYGRLGVRERIRFHREYNFLEPGGRLSRLAAGALPAPAHFAVSFAGLAFLTPREKLSIARALVALRRERSRPDLDRLDMSAWLEEKRQTPRAIQRFWRPVLVSALNEEPGRVAAGHAFQVFRLGFLAGAEASLLGVPDVPLSELYAPALWTRYPQVTIRLRCPVERFELEEGRVCCVVAGGERRTADYYISSVPFEKAGGWFPWLDLSGWEHSPITGIHLWFDRPVTDLPHAALLDRTIQWFFSKQAGRYLLVVVSASRGLVEMGRDQLIQLALRELREFLPESGRAGLERAHVIKEVRATFSPQPGIEARRPPQRSPIGNLFLAGDWTRSGWPATMEGAVRSGYLAAEALLETAGQPRRFLRHEAS